MTMFAQLIHGNIWQIFLFLAMAAYRASNCSSHLLPQNRLLHAQEFFDRIFWNTLAGVSLICITCSEHFVCFRRLVTQITDVPSRSTWRTSKCRTNSSFGNNYCACHIGKKKGSGHICGLRKELATFQKTLAKGLQPGLRTITSRTCLHLSHKHHKERSRRGYRCAVLKNTAQTIAKTPSISSFFCETEK